MKLEVGQFVRTKEGIIDKVINDYNGHCANPNCEYKHISCAKNYYDEDTVTKASYNIIDILEVGDYVNGRKVYQVGYNFQDDFVLKMSKSNYDDFIYPNEIETIVTHEQMEQMEYKVGE